MNTNKEKNEESDEANDALDLRRTVGFHGEDLATHFMEENGWEVVARNYELSMGEIDLVVSRYEKQGFRTERTLVFVEVKTRRTKSGPPPEAAVHKRKRQRLVRLGRVFMQKEKIRRVNVRFDVIAVDLSADEPDITHFPGAFDADGAIC